jgi:hypothetical protein
MRQHQVGKAFLVDIQRAGRRFVQGRFPDVEGTFVDQRNVRRPVGSAQPGRQFQSSGASTYDHDTMGEDGGGGCRHGAKYSGADVPFRAILRVSTRITLDLGWR